uniref:Uncharacterized protein n=1 Tax=Klebsiella pneumoniae TaxID=573 RepID=A0A2P1BNN4_KLEPN|nr:hypothetical protein [Klebsiella pneumoniae]
MMALSSSGKPELSQPGMINAIENLHQLSAVRTWRTFVEQLQLRNTGAGEVIQHHTGFGIPVPVLPDTLQSRCGGRNDVPGVLSGVSSFSVATLP